MTNQFQFLMNRSEPIISSIQFINHREFEGKELTNVVKSLLD